MYDGQSNYTDRVIHMISLSLCLRLCGPIIINLLLW